MEAENDSNPIKSKPINKPESVQRTSTLTKLAIIKAAKKKGVGQITNKLQQEDELELSKVKAQCT